MTTATPGNSVLPNIIPIQMVITVVTVARCGVEKGEWGVGVTALETRNVAAASPLFPFSKYSEDAIPIPPDGPREGSGLYTLRSGLPTD